MTEVHEAIEEVIEESYLLGLTESEIREDIGRFVETCWKVIRKHVKDKRLMNELAERLEEARASVLIADQIESTGKGGMLKSDGTPKTHQELIAERAARNKRRLLRAIRECDPKLVELIEKERYRHVRSQHEGEFILPSGRRPHTMRLLILKGCYIVTILFMLLLIYVMVLEKLR
ncbi:MAG: hypothetical protein HY709_08625 [Candidatus Latescibacteria bacterium]|nr:hypothetical protein [Candidatus Latescibacterota bacterium]